MSTTGQNDTEDKAAYLYRGSGENRLYEAPSHFKTKLKTRSLKALDSITLGFLSNSIIEMGEAALEVWYFLR